MKPCAADAYYFGIARNELLHWKKPLSGACDSGDYWECTIEYHVVADLEMVPTIGDHFLYIKKGRGGIEGPLGKIVNEKCHGGNKTFQALTEKTFGRFDCRSRVWDAVDFICVSIHTMAGYQTSFTIGRPLGPVPAASRCRFRYFCVGPRPFGLAGAQSPGPAFFDQ